MFLSPSVSSPRPLVQVNDTRVRLQDTDPGVVGSDYINANFVRVSLRRLRHRRWRTPTPSDVVLFWVFQEDVGRAALTGSFCVCRTTCGSPAIRRFTSPPRGASQQLSMISGRWYGRRTRGWSSWQQERSRKGGSVSKHEAWKQLWAFFLNVLFIYFLSLKAWKINWLWWI